MTPTAMDVKKMETALRRAEADDTAGNVSQTTGAHATAYATVTTAATAATTATTATTAVTAPTTATTATMTTIVAPANAVKAPAPPPPREPQTPHPLDGEMAARAMSATVLYDAKASKIVTVAHGAHVANLIQSTAKDTAIAAARVGMRVRNLHKAILAADDGADADADAVAGATGLASASVAALQRHVPGLVLDATSLGHMAYHHVRVFGEELTRTSQWMRDAQARATVLARRLAARERDVLSLRKELATARSLLASKHDQEQEQGPEQEPEQEPEHEPEHAPEQKQKHASSEAPLSVKAKAKDDEEEKNYKHKYAILKTYVDGLHKTHARAIGREMQHSRALETQLAQARAELKEATGVDPTVGHKCETIDGIEVDIDVANKDNDIHDEVDDLCSAESHADTDSVSDPEEENKAQGAKDASSVVRSLISSHDQDDEDSQAHGDSQDQGEDGYQGESQEQHEKEGQGHEDGQGSASEAACAIVLTPPANVPKISRLVEPKIHVRLLRPDGAQVFVAISMASPGRRLLTPGWAHPLITPAALGRRVKLVSFTPVSSLAVAPIQTREQALSAVPARAPSTSPPPAAAPGLSSVRAPRSSRVRASSSTPTAAKMMKAAERGWRN